ncbi:fimbrial biogenesis chaperone, partial [Escherichia coli]|uniref:fimbrial biogenesis chaperone n=1 Tax=Escherichia coli TaxID=562 RepID=UPI001D0CA50C
RHRSVRLVILVGLAIDQIAQSGLSSLSVIYYSAQLFSVRAVPSTTKRKEGNTLKIATQSVIKLFWRPKGLAYPLGEAPAKLRCTSLADMVTVSNPTPYFITLTDLKIGGKVVKNQMISPFDKYQFSLPKGAKNSSVTYRTINDYGAETPQLNCKS